jgi:adenine-specific DNA-methyltransferase
MIHGDQNVARHAAPTPADISAVPLALRGQLAFWTPEEVWAISGEEPRHRRADLRKRGAFATPPELARDVAGAVRTHLALGPNDMVDFGDPAFGNGVLFAALREAVGPDRINSARVIEIDPLTARSSAQRWSRSGISVLTGDFLSAPAERDAWSLVMANPPYRRSQDISQDLSHLRAALVGRLGITLSARADLYAYFLLQSDAWMREDAVAAWIIPAEFQVTAYGAALRKYLSTRVTLLRMHTYDSSDPLFDNALASTSVVVFRKALPAPEVAVDLTAGGTMLSPTSGRVVTHAELRQSDRWSFASLSSPANHRDVGERMGDLFTFRRGIATGANSYFVLTDEQLTEYEVDRKWVRPLVPAAREIRDGHIRAGADMDPIPSSGRWLIDTTSTIEEIRKESQSFASYLENVEASVGDRYLVARRPSSFKQEQRDPAPYLFLYMAKRDTTTHRFLWNESRGIHLNNLIGMYPRPSLWEQFDSSAAVFDRLTHIQNSHLERAGRIYGNGLLKLEPMELANLRIPK